MLNKAPSTWNKEHFWYRLVSFNYLEKFSRRMGWNARLASLIDRYSLHCVLGCGVFCGVLGFFFDYAEQVDHFLLKYLLDLLKIKMSSPSFPPCSGNQVKQTIGASQSDLCKLSASSWAAFWSSWGFTSFFLMTSQHWAPLQEQALGSHQGLDMPPAFQSTTATLLKGEATDVTTIAGELS